jgi:hypothetical protein
MRNVLCAAWLIVGLAMVATGFWTGDKHALSQGNMFVIAGILLAYMPKREEQ